MNDYASVVAIVLNWNNGKDTITCLESLRNCLYDNLRVVVCDNGSSDNSVSTVESWAKMQRISCDIVKREEALTSKDQSFNSWLTIVTNGENIGYARGNNIGIRFAIRLQADYIFILNNDTSITLTTIMKLVQFGAQTPSAALMAPKIYQPHGDGFIDTGVEHLKNPPNALSSLVPQWMRRKAHNVTTRKIQTKPLRIYYAPGCAMMFRSAAFERVGLFDESTFLYYEEFIMAEKLKQAGLATYYVPDAEVYHLHGATTATLTPVTKYLYSVKSQKYYFHQYRRIGWPIAFALSCKVTMAFLLKAIINPSYRRAAGEFLETYF